MIGSGKILYDGIGEMEREKCLRDFSFYYFFRGIW